MMDRTIKPYAYSEEIVPLRIALLGGFRVWVSSHLIPDEVWKRRKVQALVKLLALASRHCLHREHLMNLLWPDTDIEAARNNLRQTLHLARQILKSESNSVSGMLTDHNGWLCLTHEGEIWVDTEAFETAAAQCRQSKNAKTCQTAVSLYTGELLPEDRYEDWVTTRRESLRDLYLDLLSELGRMFETLGDIEQAIDIFHQAVALDPTAEYAHRTLMRLYAATGRRLRALQQYHRLREILDRELGLDPDPESRKLYEDILSNHFQTEITQK
jgi:DNA-binding SARP family transcriptional activator